MPNNSDSEQQEKCNAVAENLKDPRDSQEGLKYNGIIVTQLAILPKDALLDETALARALGISKRTVRRMVGRFELPPPVRFAGRSTWQAGKVLTYFEEAAERASREAAQKAKEFRRL